LGHEVDCSLPSSIKVKNEWSYTSVLSLFAFMAWTGIFTFLVLQGETSTELSPKK
jgi:hypothetical protein